MFRLLNTSSSGLISLNEFYHVYDVLGMKWRKREESPHWFDNCRSSIIASSARLTHRLVTWTVFDFFVCELFSNHVTIRKSSNDSYYRLGDIPRWNHDVDEDGRPIHTPEEPVRVECHLGDVRFHLVLRTGSVPQDVWPRLEEVLFFRLEFVRLHRNDRLARWTRHRFIRANVHFGSGTTSEVDFL